MTKPDLPPILTRADFDTSEEYAEYLAIENADYSSAKNSPKKTISIPPKDQEKLALNLLEPAPPNEALTKAFSTYDKVIRPQK